MLHVKGETFCFLLILKPANNWTTNPNPLRDQLIWSGKVSHHKMNWLLEISSKTFQCLPLRPVFPSLCWHKCPYQSKIFQSVCMCLHLYLLWGSFCWGMSTFMHLLLSVVQTGLPTEGSRQITCNKESKRSWLS